MVIFTLSSVEIVWLCEIVVLWMIDINTKTSVQQFSEHSIRVVDKNKNDCDIFCGAQINIQWKFFFRECSSGLTNLFISELQNKIHACSYVFTSTAFV